MLAIISRYALDFEIRTSPTDFFGSAPSRPASADYRVSFSSKPPDSGTLLKAWSAFAIFSKFYFLANTFLKIIAVLNVPSRFQRSLKSSPSSSGIHH